MTEQTTTSQRRAGRPRVGEPTGGGASPQWKFTPRAGQLDKLDAEAAELGTTRSELVRDLIDQHFARKGRKRAGKTAA